MAVVAFENGPKKSLISSSLHLNHYSDITATVLSRDYSKMLQAELPLSQFKDFYRSVHNASHYLFSLSSSDRV